MPRDVHASVPSSVQIRSSCEPENTQKVNSIQLSLRKEREKQMERKMT